MAGSFAVSHAKSTPPPAFLKDQLLIRSVLWLIDQRRWAWMTTPHSNLGHVTEIFSLSLLEKLAEAPAWSKQHEASELQAIEANKQE